MFEDIMNVKMWDFRRILSTLPNLISLEKSNFLKYKRLKKFLKVFESLTYLKRLKMEKYKILEDFLSRLPNFITLEELKILKYKKLKKLLVEFWRLSCLKILKI